MLRGAGISFLESEFDFTFNEAHKKLVNALYAIGFDFDNYEPVFVRFSGTDTPYIYQAKRDALVVQGDLLIVPTGGIETEVLFKIAEVMSTFQDLNINRIPLDQTIGNIERFKNVRPIVANLGLLSGDFFDDYFFEVQQKEHKKHLLDDIEKRAKVAKKQEYFKNIARYDPIMERMLSELEELGGF